MRERQGELQLTICQEGASLTSTTLNVAPIFVIMTALQLVASKAWRLAVRTVLVWIFQNHKFYVYDS